MAVKNQLTVFLQNKIGRLSALAAALARQKVNIDAISVCDTADSGTVRLVVSDEAKAKRVLKKFCPSVVESPVVVALLPNKPGVLAKAAARIARAKVNIEYVYGSTGKSGDRALVVFRVSDVRAADRAIKAATL